MADWGLVSLVSKTSRDFGFLSILQLLKFKVAASALLL